MRRLVVAALLASACATSSTFREAEQAERREDYDEAVLLYSRALKENPENGIEITEEIAAAFDGVSLPLDGPARWRYELMERDPQFRVVMGRVREVLGDRPIVKRAYAVSHSPAARAVRPSEIRVSARGAAVARSAAWLWFQRRARTR